MTREEARAIAPLFSDFCSGAKMQYKDAAGGWRDTESLTSEWQHRIKPELKFRPWRCEEVPMPCVMRRISEKINRFQLVCVLPLSGAAYMGYPVNDRSGHSMRDLLEQMEHSTDGGKTWLPCGVLENSQ